jgi:hypothetical protein
MKRLAKHMDASCSRLPDVSETMVELAHDMVDDFNNILTTVMGACSLIDKSETENKELRQCIAVIRSSAERAVVLSGKLLQVCLPSREAQGFTPVVAGRNRRSPRSSKRDKQRNDGIVPREDLSGEHLS